MASALTPESERGPAGDHAHASHSVCDQFEQEEFPGFVKCDVWQELLPCWSSRPPSFIYSNSNTVSRISHPDSVNGQRPERRIFIRLYSGALTEVETAKMERCRTETECFNSCFSVQT